jgi:Asp-tRNA(Asn)/Glu-tRNA(Gln) amidotransferase A subunit family amidase
LSFQPESKSIDLYTGIYTNTSQGDGYQAPGGSSSGPGAGIGAYDWLDIAVGSDTGGSMRSPGGMQGLFANRPSTGAVSLDDVIPLCHALDTAGVFSRNAATWSKVLHAWYQNFTDYREYPKKIFYQDSSFPATNTSAGAMLEEFVVKVEDFLATKREHVNISSQWEKTHPSTTAGAINDVLNTVGFKLSKIYHHMLMKHNRHTLS